MFQIRDAVLLLKVYFLAKVLILRLIILRIFYYFMKSSVLKNEVNKQKCFVLDEIKVKLSVFCPDKIE